MQDIVIYTTAICPYCIEAKALLARKGVSYQEKRVDLDIHLRTEMLQKSGGRRTVPQIFIGDELIGGFDELWNLEQNGLLDAKLKVERT